MNILVIDDNVALCETLAIMLETMGHLPTVALTGYSGIEAAKAKRPALILLDLGLPDITGYETCRLLRKLNGLEETVIVAQSGHDELSDVQQAKDAGFDRLLVKPARSSSCNSLLPQLRGVRHLLDRTRLAGTRQHPRRM